MKKMITSLSFPAGIAFAVYNGFLGFYYSCVWNSSICIYYVLLSVVRGIIAVYRKKADGNRCVKKIYLVTHIILFMMNLSLIIPIAVMIRGDRPYNLGMIPAITMAVYTTYRIVMAVMNYSKSGKNENIQERQLGTANLIDALVAVLTLQNTMIIASDGEITQEMRILSIVSSTAIWLVIMALTVLSLGYSLKKVKDPKAITQKVV